MKFGKTIVYVPDVSASLAFYERAFGIPTRFAQGDGYGELETGETTLAFASFPAGQQHLPDGVAIESPRPEAVSVEIALISDDVEADFARAVEAGAEPVQQPDAKPWGQTVSYLRTPDGTIVDLSSAVAAWS